MDFINILFNGIDSVGTIIGILSTLTLIVQGVLKFRKYISKKRYIKKTLNFSEKNCLISCSIYIDQNAKAVPPVEVVTHISFKAHHMLNDMLGEVGYSIKQFTIPYEGNNVIHIGGPAANIHVNALFADRLNRFKYHTLRRNEIMHQSLGLSNKCIVYNDNDEIFFQIGNKRLELSAIRDYAIFIRIPYDHKRDIDYTTHIIFGGWGRGTEKAFEFFTKNYKMIAKKYKKSKYCFAIPINRTDYNIALISNEDIIDLTDELFGNN